MQRQNFDWIKEDQFQETVEELAIKHGWIWILSLPGVYEIIAEELNNEALEELARENNRCNLCGNDLDDEGYCTLCDK